LLSIILSFKGHKISKLLLAVQVCPPKSGKETSLEEEEEEQQQQQQY